MLRQSDWSRKWQPALLGAIGVIPSLFALWGFTVDDALIIARVAAHLKHGLGYRFNVPGPVVDAVTPLGFAHLVALFPGNDSLELFNASRCLGVALWCATAAIVVGRLDGRHQRAVAALALATSVVGATWAVSGMETALVALLAILGTTRAGWAGLGAGLAAALRPELLPWALTVRVGYALSQRDPGESLPNSRRVLVELAKAMGPGICVMVIRAWAFGRPIPLAALAKPSDVEHGIRYALGALAFSGPAWLLLAPQALKRLSPERKVLLVAASVHFAVLTLIGGDWMPFFRLAVPVLPSMIVVGAELASHSRPFWVGVRLTLCIAASAILAVYLGPDARGVWRDRSALLERARPELAGRHYLAALDIGWVGAASSAPVFDLAGVTDPSVAILRGGHTSKHVPFHALEARGVDTLVLQLAPGAQAASPWFTSSFATQVEQRLAQDASSFQPHAQLSLGRERHYFVLYSVPPANPLPNTSSER